MSVDLVVFMSRAAMPAPQTWANAIVEAGFPAELDSDFDVDTFSGFLPCAYDGAEAGFEYFAAPAEPNHPKLPPEVDFSVTFTTHADMRELAAATVAAAVLCGLTDGILYDPQADLVVPASDASTWAREQLDEIEL